MLHAALTHGGLEPRLTAQIKQEMWDKFVLLAAYAGMTCMMRAPIGVIMATENGEATMLSMLDECVATAKASGHEPGPVFLHDTRAMLTQRGSSGAASMLRDIDGHRRTEGEHVLGDMLSRARTAGLSTPLLRVAHAHLQAYEFGL